LETQLFSSRRSLKAAENCRTPKRDRHIEPGLDAAFWKAAVFRRFSFDGL
jgi:hypothetical protein